jgi:hypothetical protein
MQLSIETFTNSRGGNSFYKAVTHPLAARAWPAVKRRLAARGPVAVYDIDGCVEALAELHDFAGLDVAGVFAQDLAALGRTALGRAVEPVTALAGRRAATLFVASFEAERPIEHVRHLLPPGIAVESLDALRLPADLVTNPRRYLDPLNFATNFVFFRDAEGLHTRLVTANYWSGYGAETVALWLLLFDEHGEVLAEWREAAPQGLGSIVLDSHEVRARFGLPEFTGQLFLHVVGASGHDVVKYALDTYGEGDGSLSATHDANAWPAELYAGLPAPAAGERVTLWLQNSQPCPIPPGAVALNLMGDDAAIPVERAIAPFASHALDVADVLPAARWPQQVEVRAGKYMVRPRYEVTRGGRRRIAHVNVERPDLRPDPALPALGKLLGKGYLLPAPLLPRRRWRSLALPTPMATDQAELPIALLVYDPLGREVARHRLGRLARRQSVAIDSDALLGAADLADGYGHVELVYDFAAGGEADGWLHALFRYEDRASGHAAETSFGAHVFNTALTYRGEPQSYAGRPPGLSTRLFLRLGESPLDTFCHLIYPASAPWHPRSATDLVLCAGDGREIARERVAIPCSGSLFWRYHEVFDAAVRGRAGPRAYVIIRDLTCRLFGYHGLLGRDGGFSLDHMFGF